MISLEKLPSNIGEVKKIKIQNRIGAFTEILSLGAAIKSICVPDNSGKLTDVVLGYDTPDEYLKNDGYYGAMIGRNANRIRDGKFTLNGKEYILPKNEKYGQLHGGVCGFDKKIWEVKDMGEDFVTLSLFSPDGEEGFPANLYVEVCFTWDDSCNLSIEYRAKADDDTIVNLTNHSYFNLSGGKENILETDLKIKAQNYTQADEHVYQTGEILPANGTALDFRAFKKIGRDIGDPSLLYGGYDHNFCLDGEAFREVCRAECKKSGISLTVSTTLCGLQLYTSNVDLKRSGKGGSVYGKFAGFCLETQFWPDGANFPHFPSPILKKDEQYSQKTVYTFDVIA